MISIGQVKISKRLAKHCALGPKQKKMPKDFKKVLRIFNQNSKENSRFFT